jgi:hypothetical protein
MSLGSEFKPAEVLEPLLGNLESWPMLKESMISGAQCPQNEVDKNTLQQEFRIAVNKGNARSANEDSEWIAEQFQDEVEKGWTLALPLRAAAHFPTGVYAPLSVIEQDTINESGDVIPKKRLVHNLSKEGALSGDSVNSRTEKEKLETVKYGFAHKRVLHYIVALRQRYPKKIIWLSKGDFKSAYRRKHASWKATLLSLTSILCEGFAYLLTSLRLTFGGKFCVPGWCLTSEAVTDVGNALLQCEDWNHQVVKSRWSHLIPEPIPLPPVIPFEPARPTIVHIPDEPWGKIDCFIDDLPGIGLDVGDNAYRVPEAILLAMDIFTRQYKDYPLPRDEMPSLTKLAAELGSSEQKIILGWKYDTRRMLVSLPENKYVAWSNDICKIIAKQRALHHELDTLVGRLDHTCCVFPLARHFMERIRFAKQAASKNPYRPYSLNSTICSDLKLMLKILTKTNLGINMNLLTFRTPNTQSKVDACPYGIGGFSKLGRAWRWKIPSRLVGRAHINLLEFIACLIAIWLDIIEGTASPLDCILVMGDSTTAIGWVHKTQVKKKDMIECDFQARTTIARKITQLMLDNNMCLYTQWFPGKANAVADSLSRDFDIPDDQLTSRLKSFFPTQLPTGFQISPLPAEIISFVSSTLCGLKRRTQSPEVHKTSDLHPGASGKISSTTVESLGTTFWMDTSLPIETYSSLLSPTQGDTRARKNLCPLDTSKIPLDMFHRPSDALDG